MPSFSKEVLPASGVWTVAYVPDNSTMIDRIMRIAESQLNKKKKSELEKKCGFGKNVWKENCNSLSCCLSSFR